MKRLYDLFDFIEDRAIEIIITAFVVIMLIGILITTIKEALK